MKKNYTPPEAEMILFTPTETVANSDWDSSWRALGDGIDTPLVSADPID